MVFYPKLIDYYNHPKPNFNKLIEAIKEIYDNYEKYKNLINYKSLNIDLAAYQYQSFINKVYNEKNI